MKEKVCCVKNQRVRYGIYVSTKIGKLYVAEENGCLVRLDSGEADKEDILQETSFLLDTTKQLKEYLAGQRQQFEIPVHMEGSDFRKKVWRALMCIPYGETRTYGEIAKEIGSPGGARAVGGACNHNPVMIIVPCHRVIGSNGKLVGFGGGLPMKEALLRLEGIPVKTEDRNRR